MGLRNDAWFGKSLLKSAQLLGRNSDDLIMDRKTNIRAAAAYLRSLAMEEDARGGSISMDAQTALTKNLLPWSKVIERYSGIPGADAKIYASEILAAMAPWNPPMVEAASQQSPPIIWDPTPNHSGRLHPRFIVIHTTEGPYATAISWFKNPESAASAHYVIRGDGAITQMVDDDTVAWHARCWNDYAIGIEHEAYSTNGSGMTNALYNSSARLVKMLAEKYNIPLDKDHIIGHDFWETKEFLSTPVLGDCQDHNDPGPYWDWRRYFNSLMENI
jgi:hypothetical protein